jgi:hypothetical protein
VTDASQSAIIPRTSCTAGEHSMQRAIGIALLTAIRNLALHYYSSPPSPDVASSRLGIKAEFDSDADIFDRTHGGPISERGSKALEPLLREREQGALTSEQRENCITLGSPLCRGLIRATYILCIEHPRLMRLSRESNPGPPATAGKHSMQRAIQMALLTAIRDLAACTTTSYHIHKNWGLVE